MVSSGSLRRLLAALRRIVRSDQLVLLVLAVVLGALAAAGATGFRYLVLLIQGVSFGAFTDTRYTAAEALPAWQIIFVPTAGGLFIWLFIHFFMPRRRPCVRGAWARGPDSGRLWSALSPLGSAPQWVAKDRLCISAACCVPASPGCWVSAGR